MPTSVTIRFATHVADHHRAIIGKAEILLEEVLKRPEFSDQVKSADYSGGKLFKESNGKVVVKEPPDILDIILKGAERDTGGANDGDNDNDLDMTISPYPHRKGVVGSAGLGRQPIKPAIWFLEQCAKRNDAVSLAGHLMHEWLHVAGFFHSRSGHRRDDVPYEVGNIVRKVARLLRNDAKFDRSELKGFMVEDDLAAYFLEESEDEVDYPDDW